MDRSTPPAHERWLAGWCDRCSARYRLIAKDRTQQTLSLGAQVLNAGLRWWHRYDHRAAPWLVPLCDEHGQELQKYGFQIGHGKKEKPFPSAPPNCEVCANAGFIGIVKRCTCNRDGEVACPEHGGSGGPARQ